MLHGILRNIDCDLVLMVATKYRTRISCLGGASRNILGRKTESMWTVRFMFSYFCALFGRPSFFISVVSCLNQKEAK
jgi:hypothetical protein